MSRTTSTPLNAALNGEPACICKAWTIHCGCGKSISHEDVAKLRRRVKRLREENRMLENKLAEIRDKAKLWIDKRALKIFGLDLDEDNRNG